MDTSSLDRSISHFYVSGKPGNVHGHLVSVSEEFYDNFILREIEAEEEQFSEATIIGRILGKYRLGIGDYWIAFRIEEMIHAGKLEALTTASKDMPSYHRLLKRS